MNDAERIAALEQENVSLRTELARHDDIARCVIEAGDLPQPVYGESLLKGAYKQFALLQAMEDALVSWANGHIFMSPDEARKMLGFNAPQASDPEDDEDTDTPVYTPTGCPSCGAPDGDVCDEKCPERIARAKASALDIVVVGPSDLVGELPPRKEGEWKIGDRIPGMIHDYILLKVWQERTPDHPEPRWMGKALPAERITQQPVYDWEGVPYTLPDCSCAACQNTTAVPHAPGCQWSVA